MYFIPTTFGNTSKVILFRHLYTLCFKLQNKYTTLLKNNYLSKISILFSLQVYSSNQDSFFYTYTFAKPKIEWFTEIYKKYNFMYFLYFWQYYTIRVFSNWSPWRKGYLYLKTTRTNTFIAIGSQLPILNIAFYFLREYSFFTKLSDYEYLNYLKATYKHRFYKSHIFDTKSSGSFGLLKKDRRSSRVKEHIIPYVLSIIQVFLMHCKPIDHFYFFLNGISRHAKSIIDSFSSYFISKFELLESKWFLFSKYCSDFSEFLKTHKFIEKRSTTKHTHFSIKVTVPYLSIIANVLKKKVVRNIPIASLNTSKKTLPSFFSSRKVGFFFLPFTKFTFFNSTNIKHFKSKYTDKYAILFLKKQIIHANNNMDENEIHIKQSNIRIALVAKGYLPASMLSKNKIITPVDTTAIRFSNLRQLLFLYSYTNFSVLKISSLVNKKNSFKHLNKQKAIVTYFNKLKTEYLLLKEELLSLMFFLPKLISIKDYSSQPYNGCRRVRRYKKRAT